MIILFFIQLVLGAIGISALYFVYGLPLWFCDAVSTVYTLLMPVLMLYVIILKDERSSYFKKVKNREK